MVSTTSRAIRGSFSHTGPVQSRSKARSAATKACPGVGYGRDGSPAGSEPHRRQVRTGRRHRGGNAAMAFGIRPSKDDWQTEPPAFGIRPSKDDWQTEPPAPPRSHL